MAAAGKGEGEYHWLQIPEDHVFPKASSVPEAQRWFEQGYAWCAGFHREEAAFCFERAAAADPRCALAQWGLGIAHGPDYNFSEKRGFFEVAKQETGWPSVKIALDAAAKAKELAAQPESGVSPAHHAMIDALVLRYEWPLTDNAPMLKTKYADAMAAAHEAFPANVEVAIAAAEAVSCYDPWNLYDRTDWQKPVLKDVGAKFKAYVNAGLKTDPYNHWLCHLKIHLNEMGPVDHFDWHSAEVLRAPGVPVDGIANSHLLHMPTHLDIQVGAYGPAMKWNVLAYQADQRLMKVSPRQRVWPGYLIHNIEFCAWAAFYGGNRATALEAARQMNIAMPPELVASDPNKIKYFESYTTLESMALVRFGLWSDVLKLKFRDDDVDAGAHLMHTLFLRFARGVAYGAMGDVASARAEQAAFLELLPTLKVGDRFKHNVDGRAMAEIAREVLDGEVLYRDGNYDEAFAALRRAVALVDALPYDEPHGWLMSARQTLGALLTEQGFYEEACTAYTEDLAQFPNNVWSLSGLRLCHAARRDPRLADVEARLERAQKSADFVVTASCACALSHWKSAGSAPKAGSGSTGACCS